MLIVQKYGGSSVATPERIRSVAARVAAAHRRGERLVVVVSAMGDSTDELIELAARVVGHTHATSRHAREMDMLLTAGERISMALLAMAIRECGCAALSLTGSQAAIITDGAHTAARIREIRADRIRAALDEEQVVIVAGFQGVSGAHEVTTLGRGGSDTSAVALAAALGAARCEIYSDVRGVYTCDPRRIPGARIVPSLAYEELLELAAGGAQVVHPRAVEIAARFAVDLRLGTAFEESEETIGTLVTRTPPRMEEMVLTGISARGGQARLILRGLPAGLQTVTGVLLKLAEAGVSIDMMSEAEAPDGHLQLQLTLAEEALAEAEGIAREELERLGGGEVQIRRNLSRIALVGSGMHQRPGVYAHAYRALLEAAIEVFAVSTSGISIAVLVEADREIDAVRALHDAFTLESIDGVAPSEPIVKKD